MIGVLAWGVLVGFVLVRVAFVAWAVALLYFHRKIP